RNADVIGPNATYTVSEWTENATDDWSDIGTHTVAANITELFISEYAEGSSSNKYIEIYNGTGADVDLTNYTVELYSNGDTTASQTLDLTGTLVAGDVLIIANSSADQTILDEADYALSYPSVPNWNGDDVVTLSKDGAIIDTIGDVGNPNNNYFAQDVTLVRNADVIGPNATYTVSEWTENATDDWSDIGTHTTN
ncbi:MAG TPA: lamin tail domain-containing protein, partial [Candidatus Izemoplasmatales bacterium]|nr:lamin tail domain-containing protein [Candidatus Izemoplasmatales bacterium]